MRKNYSDEIFWFLKDRIEKLYRIYQEFLQLRLDSTKKFPLVQCSQCQIGFSTTGANRDRKDIRCSFGCRLIHKKKMSNKRSTEYNRSPEGRTKKKIHNQRRKKIVIQDEQKPPPPVPSAIDLYIRLVCAAIFKRKIEIYRIQQLRQMAQAEMRQHPLELIIELLILRGYG